MNNTYIKNKLSNIARDNWETYKTIFFNDYELYRNSLETIYSYIANRTVRKILRDQIDLFDDVDIFRLKSINIHSDNFNDLFSRFRINGKKRCVSYSTLIHILVNSGILHQNKSYCYKSLENKRNGFDIKINHSKSYSLSNSFIKEIVKSGFLDYDSIYKSFYAYYPNRLLQRKNEKAKKLFQDIKKLDYLEKLDFDYDFFDGVSTFGWYFDDDRLDVEEMVRDLQAFKRHNSGKYVDHRFFDWFTSVSSAFRTHITVNGKHYREAYDFHAGMFWMLSIFGYKIGKIDLFECESLIDHCFFGNFYSDISGREKTKELKEKFMVYLNGHKGIHYLAYNSDDDGTFKTISNNLWKNYPKWSKMIMERRNELKGDVGFLNYLESTKIEKDLYLAIEKKLIECGYRNIRRVHDAIYITDDIDDIDFIIRGLVDEYMAGF